MKDAKPGDNQDQREDDMDDIARLIRAAGARETVEAVTFTRAKSRVEAHWQQVVADERRLKRPNIDYRFGVAAGILVAIAATFVLMRGVLLPEPAIIASVTQVSGAVTVDGKSLAVGAAIRESALIHTQDAGRAELLLESGHLMRLDSDSRLLARNGREFRLDGGSVYVESDTAAPTAGVFVETDFGVVTDVGTQFQVKLTAGSMLVGVREGLVRLDRDGLPVTEVNVDQLLTTDGQGPDEISDLPSDDHFWAWSDSMSSDNDSDEVLIRDFLRDYAAARNLQLVWRSAISEAAAGDHKLSFPVAASLEERMQIATVVANITYELDGETIIFSVGE